MDPTAEPQMTPKISNLPWKITLVILLLVLLGEVGYILFGTYYKNKTVSKLPIPIETSKIYPNSKQEYKGKLIELVIPDDPLTTSETNAKFFLKFEVIEGGIKKFGLFFFDKNDLKNMKVTNSAGKSISYRDLKIGNNIILKIKPIEIRVLD